METIKLEINDKEYDVIVLRTEAEKEKGLQDVVEMDESEGALFIYDTPQTLEFWMKDTEIPLDIIFIDEDWEVVSVKQGQPLDETILSEDNVQYVLELNQNSGVKEGDEIDVEDDDLNPGRGLEPNHTYIYGSDGNVQAEIVGGERIFSIKNTKTLIRMAKRAYATKSETNYKRLGKKIFEYLHTQDSNEPDYVSQPSESIKNKKGE